MSRSDGDLGEAHDLTAPDRTRGAEEEELARALHDSLDGRAVPEPSALVAAALRRTGRRRRRRLLGAPVAAVAAAAVVVALVLGAGALRHDRGLALASPSATTPSVTRFQVQLSTEDVDAVIPGAQSFLGRGPYRPDPPISAPGNACGTAVLPGLAVPSHAGYQQWAGTPSTTQETASDGSTSTTTSVPILLFADAYSWTDHAHAAAYPRSLLASASSCPTAASSELQVIATPAFLAGGALFTTAYSDGAWNVTAVAVDQRITVTLQGQVPGAHTAAGARTAATALAHLAATAARRAARS
jgi:hypothetical protein